MFPEDPRRNYAPQKFYPLIVGYDTHTGRPLFGIPVDTESKVLVSTTPVVFPVDPVRSMVWCEHCGGKCTRMGDIYPEDEDDYDLFNDYLDRGFAAIENIKVNV